MSDLPEFARDTAETVERQGKVLIPWLPDPYTCDDCGAYCDATEEYVDQQAMIVDVWKCPECESRYYRDSV